MQLHLAPKPNLTTRHATGGDGGTIFAVEIRVLAHRGSEPRSAMYVKHNLLPRRNKSIHC